MDKAFDLQPITILSRYVDLGEEIVETYSVAFLTSPKHAIFASDRILLITEVKPTNDPSVYEMLEPTMELGRVHDLSQSAPVIESVTKKLKQMTAYEFVAEIMLKVNRHPNFGDMIVPASSKRKFLKSTLESGVA